MAQNFFLKEPSPTKVVVVNDPENLTQVVVKNFPLSLNGSLSVNLNTLRPFAASYYNIFLDNIILLQGDGTIVVLPLNSFFLNLQNSQINSILASYKTAYSILVSNIASATLHYSKQSLSGGATSEVYDLKSAD